MPTQQTLRTARSREGRSGCASSPCEQSVQQISETLSIRLHVLSVAFDSSSLPIRFQVSKVMVYIFGELSNDALLLNLELYPCCRLTRQVVILPEHWQGSTVLSYPACRFNSGAALPTRT